MLVRGKDPVFFLCFFLLLEFEFPLHSVFFAWIPATVVEREKEKEEAG